MTDTEREHARRETIPPFGAMTLEHLRLYGSGWCTEATFDLMMDVIQAADRRRQTQSARRIVTAPSEQEWESWKQYEADYWSAMKAEDAALDALLAHLAGEEVA